MKAKEKTYSLKLKDPRWQKKRLEIMKRDKFACKLCKDDETELQVHHKEYINGNDPWDYDNSLLVTLCSHCHEEISDKNSNMPGTSFDSVKIYKSNNWKDGSRIMFVAHDETCTMRIYDSDDNFITGFNLRCDIPDIIRILKKAI